MGFGGLISVREAHIKNVLLISEVISYPFDEGLKNIVFQLCQILKSKKEVCFITKSGNQTTTIPADHVRLNKLFLNRRLRQIIRSFMPDLIIYVPEASCTFNSFLRARMLKLMSQGTKLVLLASHPIRHKAIRKAFLSYLRPDYLFLLGGSDKIFYEERGIKTKVLPPAVDSRRFHKVEFEDKIRLRKNHQLPTGKTIVLHVGHVNLNRNIDCLEELQAMKNTQVILVGSTTTKADAKLKQHLEKLGVIVLKSYLPRIEELYQLSDIYLFPVSSETGAIEMPLSILEALACNLPVVTTRFGGIPDYFKEDCAFRFIRNVAEMLEAVNSVEREDVKNDKKVEEFTWERFVDEILTTCGAPFE